MSCSNDRILENLIVDALILKGNGLWWSIILLSVELTTLDDEVQILRIYLDLRSIPLDLRSICPFVASKYCEATMHQVYHAKITVSTKNFPRSEGRKCGVKGLVQWRGLMDGRDPGFGQQGRVEKG